MLTAANITHPVRGQAPVRKHLVKFGDGNRYGLIGANGCGKSTLMKILGGDLEPSDGNVALDPDERLGKLKQDQFAYEDVRVLDVVLMGHADVGDEERARRDLRQSRRDAKRTTCAPPSSRRTSPNWAATRRRRAPASCCWASASRSRAARGSDERRGAGLEAARAARAGAVRQSGHPAARRADQPPRHQLDPLARGRAQRRAIRRWSSSRTTGTS